MTWCDNSCSSLLSGEMSRSDYPPGYDDSRGALYGLPGGNHPQPPAYGFPGFGSQPSAPYPAGPTTPLYSGQPGGYSHGPYPGQPGGYPPGPYHGQPGPPGSGYPNPPPMPPVMPPTIPSDVLGSGKTGTEKVNNPFRTFMMKTNYWLTQAAL